MGVIRFNVETYEPCLVCREPIRLTESEMGALLYGNKIDSKICDKCKQAILYVRKQMEEAGE